MKKTKKSIQSIINYFRELSIVVIGVAITVGLGFWVTNNNLKKDQKQYLDAIRLELKENSEKFDLYAKWLQKSVKYAEYLKSNDEKSLNSDSLDYYQLSVGFTFFDNNNDGCGYLLTRSFTSSFTTNALEMLKYSGVMRQIKDKELLKYIWETYAQIEEVKLYLDTCFEEKKEEANKELLLLQEKKRSTVPMQRFYTSETPYRMVVWCLDTSSVIKKMLSKLE